MGTSTRDREQARDEDKIAGITADHHHQAHDDIPTVLRDIRNILAAARADIAELLRYSRPPNDHT